MHDDRQLIQDRLSRVLSERIRPATHRVVDALRISAWHVGVGSSGPVAPSVALGDEATYGPFAVGDAWGPPWGTTWFHVEGRVPALAAGERVELRIDLGWSAHSPGFQAEGLVYRPDGTVVKGLNPLNDWVPVVDVASGGEPIDLYIEAAANPNVFESGGFAPTTLGEKATAGDRPMMYRLARADVVVLQTDVWELVQDLEVLDQLRRELPADQPRAWHILRAIGRALDAVEPDDVTGSAKQARAQLAEALDSPAHAGAHQISAVGHAHIDTAWLWPLRETVRKVARTASNVVQLLDTHDDFVYAMSSAQQFAWLAEHRPEVFARVAEHIRGGGFIPVGGMWVESDTNMPGSEAMARQLVYGKRYFLETFGVDTQEVWLPDSFGYSAALPQLVRLAGSRWFLTQKISWNRTNRFPHHTFWWEGLDGTRVFTHFPPVDTYNSELSGRELAHAVRNFRDKGGATRSLVPFGHGDGGGGPTREMLARARRTADLEGSPRVRLESPAAFFEAAEQEYDAAPVWVGELYLELHRGTYTSQAKTKQGNRRSEHLLREAELWCATAAVQRGADYPYDALERIWKTVLLHQFHDILPGSSIAWVHREARETYSRIGAELGSLIASAQRSLGGTGELDIAFNASPREREGIPALGAAPRAPEAGTVTAAEHDGGFLLESDVLRVVVDRRGLVSSVRDLVVDREVLATGRPGNRLQLHPDLPNRWDAWDIDEFYRNNVTNLDDVKSISLAGPRTVRVVRGFGRSRITQEITLQPSTRRVDFRVEVDWQEREKLLKVAMPIAVHADRAAYEIQFGHVYRPTHQNTSWDAARFEVCAHRWVHIGEPGYGVAIVNDSTYGHDVTRAVTPEGGTSSTIRLSLLRAPRFPDPDTDQGQHEMRYALVAGAELADAVAEGYALNLPLRPLTGASGVVAPLVTVEGDESVVVESVKLADDRSGDVIVRLYESLGGRASARLVPGFLVTEIAETDLLERVTGPSGLTAGTEPGQGILRLRPFQVLTVRLRRPRRQPHPPPSRLPRSAAATGPG